MILWQCKTEGSVINGIITDNNQGLPYSTKSVAFAALGNEQIVNGRNYTIQFDTALLHNNTGKTLQSISILNTNTSVTYAVPLTGTPQTISFSQAGENILRFIITNTDASSYTNYQTIFVDSTGSIAAKPSGPLCVPFDVILESTIPFQGYDEQEATISFADYHIYYHTVFPTATDCERVLRKPIIILDGFDPGDTRKTFEIYNFELKYNLLGSEILLGDDLRDKDYDVIILNFPILGNPITINGLPTNVPNNVKVNGTTQTINKVRRDGGADYIERNAFLLVKLIQDLNQQLAANSITEKLVIVGPSMGGQIARYALAYMEKQQSLGVAGMDHNTREFISFDSPNDGANIPLALQENLNLLGYNGQNQDAKDQYESQFRNPAARQLLIEQLDGLNSTASFHNTFYTNVRAGGLPGSGGYPINLRKVTLLNGAGDGTKTYSDGVEILHGEGKYLGIPNVFLLYDNFMPSYNQQLRIAITRITITRFSFPFIRVITRVKTLTNQNLRGSMDAVQGSVYNATQIVYEGIYAGLKDKGVKQVWTTVKPLHCFIPSVSVAAFKNPVADWNTNILNRNLLCNSEIYFDGYFMPKTNQGHVSLTPDNVQWLTEEIDKGTAGCPAICTFKINGNDALCETASTTYTIDNAPPAGATLTWEIEGNFVQGSIGVNSITLTGVSQGLAVLIAHIINPCGADVFIRKEIFVGPPVYGIQYFDGVTPYQPVKLYRANDPEGSINYVCLGYNNYYVEGFPTGASNMVWSEVYPQSGSGFYWYQSGNKAYFQFNVLTTQPRYLKGVLTNSCGTFELIFSFLPHNCNGGGDPCSRTGETQPYFSMSPNPADGQIRIGGVSSKPAPPVCAKTPPSTDEGGDFTFSQINIYTQAGKLVIAQNYKGAKQTLINTSRLIAGNYLVEIISGSIIEKKQLVIY